MPEQPSRPNPNPSPAAPYTPLLGLQAAAEMARHADQRSDDIAAHFGIAPAFIRRQYETNPTYWQYLERRWMREAFGPLAPMHEIARQAREDRQRLRDARRTARREAWAKGVAQKAQAAKEEDAVFHPAPAPWQHWTLAMMDFWRHLTGIGMVLAALYLIPVWFAHHGLLPLH